MSRLEKVYVTKMNNGATLKSYIYSDGSRHWEFRDNSGVGNPTDEEAEQIIKRWRMEEVK